MTILKEQVLSAFNEDQADMKFTIENGEGDRYYKNKVSNESTKGCLDDFMRLHSRLLQENFKQKINAISSMIASNLRRQKWNLLYSPKSPRIKYANMN